MAKYEQQRDHDRASGADEAAREQAAPAKPKRPTKEERALRLLAEARVEKAERLAVVSARVIAKLLREGNRAAAKAEAAKLVELIEGIAPAESKPEQESSGG